jgi:hypothetical protein
MVEALLYVGVNTVNIGEGMQFSYWQRKLQVMGAMAPDRPEQRQFGLEHHDKRLWPPDSTMRRSYGPTGP